MITARALVDVVRQALERTSAHLADVRNQLNVGLVPPSDVLSIEAQQARQRMLSIEAENIVETHVSGVQAARRSGPGRARRARSLSSHASGRAAIVADLSERRFELSTGARANRPERKALEFRIDAAEERVAAASAGSLPALTAIGGYDMARPNPRIFPIQEKWRPSWDIGVRCAGRCSTEGACARRPPRPRRIGARRRHGCAISTRSSRSKCASARPICDRRAPPSIAAAEAGVRAAAEARRVLAERFSAGVATNTDVLDAQVALLQAELDLTRARANARAGRRAARRALGR